MFSALSPRSQSIFFTADNQLKKSTEDDHYEENEDNYGILDDGIELDDSIVDEYEVMEEELEMDIPEPEDSENIDHFDFVDAIEAEHYDSLEDE